LSRVEADYGVSRIHEGRFDDRIGGNRAPSGPRKL